MALFRNFFRLHRSERLSDGFRRLSLNAPEIRLVHYVGRSTYNVCSIAFGGYRSVGIECTCKPNQRWLHTQSTANLLSKAAPKKPTTTEEHESVLNELMSVKEEAKPTQLTVAAKVVQAGRDFTYLLVVLGGFAVAGFLLWSVGSEFFSTNSPQTIYSKALKRVKQDQQVRDVLGDPISGHGELSGRGRRREPLHQEYEVEGVSYMRMKFYVKGTHRTGTVHLDLKKNGQRKYVLRFLFVELNGRPHRTIIIEDNR